MSDRRITDKRPEPTRLLTILCQIKSLSYADFTQFAKYIEVDPGELHDLVLAGEESERKETNA